MERLGAGGETRAAVVPGAIGLREEHRAQEGPFGETPVEALDPHPSVPERLSPVDANVEPATAWQPGKVDEGPHLERNLTTDVVAPARAERAGCIGPGADEEELLDRKSVV